MGRRADEKYWTIAKRIDTELKMALADGRPYELQNEIAFVLQEAVTGEYLSELARLRVIEREHGEMKAMLNTIADMENPEHYGNARDDLHGMKLKVGEFLESLTPPANADGAKE